MHLSVLKKCENIAFYNNCKAHGVVTPHHQQVVVFLSILATLLVFFVVCTLLSVRLSTVFLLCGTGTDRKRWRWGSRVARGLSTTWCWPASKLANSFLFTSVAFTESV